MRHAAMILSIALLAGGTGCSDYNLWENEDPNTPGDDGDGDGGTSGPQPDIEVSPSEISFGGNLVDCPADPETITVENVGDRDLDVTDIFIDGAGAAAFDHDGGPEILAPGEAFTFDVTFTAAAIQDYTVDVVVVSNDPDESELGVLAAGAGAESAYNEEVFNQPDVGSVDVLWVIDDSGSMSDVVTHLGDRFSSFLEAFDKTGVDYRIGVTTTDMADTGAKGRLIGPQKWIEDDDADPVGLFVAATDLGSGGSADERGMDAAYAALTSPLIDGDNAGFLRDDATLAVVVVSDEDDGSTIRDGDFISWLDGLKGDPDLSSMSAIAGDPGGFGIGCTSGSFPPVSAQPANRYANVQEATDGTFQSICDDDFDEVLAYLGYGASGLLFDFPLDQRPSSVAGIRVEVDGEEIQRHPVRGWFYDSDINAVRFSRQAVPGPTSRIVISYPVDGGC